MITIEAEVVVNTFSQTLPVLQYWNPETRDWYDSPQRIDTMPSEDVTRENPDAKILEVSERRQLVFDFEKKRYVVELPSPLAVRKLLTKQPAEVTVVKPERWMDDKQNVVEEKSPDLPGTIITAKP